ncbi:MAG: universal stress protein [Desulfatiglans sp.]|jgi:nucleotide-binding universal stress UspA family protein|nr:universal stress protein [Thermodesulfobacteriota bacterium]MEE4351315.1 universal stress protein [Desulfatiglans sp.]
MRKNVLVAFDDSENAMSAVEAVARTFTTDHEITLYSVIHDTAAVCGMYSPELSPHFLSLRREFCSLDHMKREMIHQAQQRAKERLVQAGFTEENIKLKVENVKKGIARDIIEEAKSDYSTIVLGRRGISGVKGFFLGSVSSKVVSSVKNVSVLVVD